MLRSFLLAATASVAVSPAAWAQASQAPTAPQPSSPPAATPASPAQAPAAAPAQSSPEASEGTVEGVTVTARESDVRTSIDRRSYSVAGDLQATAGSVADALRNVPSVEVDVQGNVSLRGDPNVTILIDGRPSGQFTGEGRAEALQALPADQIERVEVMTNPSAAFRADGAGVINLISKKNRRAGRFGSIRGGAGSDGRTSGGVTGTYNAGKFSFNGDAAFRHDTLVSKSFEESTRVSSAGVLQTEQTGERELEGGMSSFRAGVEYNPDEATRWSAEVRRRSIKFDESNIESFERSDGVSTRAFDRRTAGPFERLNTAVSASYLRKFSGEGHELTADLSFDANRFVREFEGTLISREPPGPGGFEDIRNLTTQDLGRFKIEYSRPMPDQAKLKTGYEFELSQNEYDTFGRRGLDEGSAPVDPNLTNRFLYDQAVHGVYATYERSFGKLGTQTGLRVEQVDIDIDQVTTGQAETNSYLRAYPSLHLSYDLSDAQRLSASYSRRVQRPPAQFLNPFLVYIDPFNVQSGNPQLEPQDTHSFEAGWQYRKDRTSYLATLFYRESYDGVTDVVFDLGEGVLLSTYDNLGERRSGGLELVANGALSKTLTYNVSGTAAWDEIDASSLGFNEERSATSIGGRANLNWQATPKDFFQLNAFVIGRRLIAQGYREPTGLLNLGYRRKVNDKLSILVTAQDVLASFRDTVVIDTPTVKDRTEQRIGRRALLVNFTYNFGQGRQRQREPGFEFENGAGPG